MRALTEQHTIPQTFQAYTSCSTQHGRIVSQVTCKEEAGTPGDLLVAQLNRKRFFPSLLQEGVQVSLKLPLIALLQRWACALGHVQPLCLQQPHPDSPQQNFPFTHLMPACQFCY